MRRLIVLCCTFLLLLGGNCRSAEKVSEVPLPAELSAAFDHLLPLTTAGGAVFNPARIAPLVDFVLSARGSASGSIPLYFENRDRRGTTSAAYSFQLRTGLQDLLRIAFNPAIPAHVLLPSSIRRAEWETGRNELVRLWNPSSLAKPIIVRGSEAEEISPDLATGTYFSYDVDRTMILFAWRGKPVLISLSRQKGRSEVGKKGVVLGDCDWDYFYSGEKGIARPGLGWVDSYMYEGFSIGVFCETGEDRPLVRAAMFKWLNAGWVNVNFVERRHIYDGLARFAGDLRQVLENPKLPSPEDLADTFGRLTRLDGTRLREFYRRHLQRLERIYGNGGGLSAGFLRLLRNPDYIQQVSRRDMEAALSLDIMKCLLGRECADPALLKTVRP